MSKYKPDYFDKIRPGLKNWSLWKFQGRFLFWRLRNKQYDVTYPTFEQKNSSFRYTNHTTKQRKLFENLDAMEVQPVNQLNNCNVAVLYKTTWKGILICY